MKSSILDDRRVVIGGTAMTVFLLLVATWFLGAGPQLAAADQHDSDRADAAVQNATLQTTLSQLAQDNERILELRAALDDSQNGLPSTTDLPAFSRQLTDVAQSAGVQLDDVTVSPPSGVVSSADGSDAAADDQTTGPQAISVSVTSTGTFVEQTQFVKGLQDGARRVLVGSTQITVEGGSETGTINGESSMTTALTVFTAPAAD